ncbi:restriction endonuclease subunit S [Enterobacter asburiae]|uniref:restriction endonuclease subunit S n=1 Tax=Enterobacter asburiae TaxID=61645 RepID=UPI002FCEAD65
MSWPFVKLEQICSRIDYGLTASAISKDDGPRFLRITDIQDDSVDWSSVPSCECSLKELKDYRLEIGDIVFARTGATTGKSYLIKELDSESVFASYLIRIRPNQKVDPLYLSYFFKSSKYWTQIAKMANGVAQPGINSTKLKDLEIPLPPLEEQHYVAAILDKVDGIRLKRKYAVKLADDFLRAAFLAIFGDPVENPKGWDVASLLEYGSFKNGMNFTKGESGSVLKCLGVGDFKSLATITCMDNIGEIELNTPPSADYLLNDGDIVFVRSNGNKALVGRCLTIYPGKEKVTFSGFCIRYRIEKSAIKPEYLNFLFRTPSMKQQMLSGGQGANIQNISQGTLSALMIPVPPLEKQLTFSKIVSFHSALMKKLYVKTVKAEDMFGSISQQYFNQSDDY